MMLSNSLTEVNLTIFTLKFKKRYLLEEPEVASLAFSHILISPNFVSYSANGANRQEYVLFFFFKIDAN